MNREQAKDRIHKYVGNGLSEAIRTIDMVYDDFEKKYKEFNCTKNNLGNLANHLEDGKEYVILVKEVDSNK